MIYKLMRIYPFHTGLRLYYDRVTAKKMQKSPWNVTIFFNFFNFFYDLGDYNKAT